MVTTLDIVPVDATVDGCGHEYVMENVIFDDVSACIMRIGLLLLTGVWFLQDLKEVLVQPLTHAGVKCQLIVSQRVSLNLQRLPKSMFSGIDGFLYIGDALR